MIYQPRRSSVRAFFILIAFVLVSIIGLYMFLVSNGHTTAQDQQRNAQPVAGSAPHILITEYAVRELDKVPADVPFVQSLNAPSTYELISLHQGSDLLPNATHLVSFESYQAIANAFKQKAIPADTRVVLYDNERWSGTPVVEQQQPFGYVQKAAELVHQHGLLFANSPAPDLNTTLEGNKQYNMSRI